MSRGTFLEGEFALLIAVLAIPLGVGFVLGYGVREMISRHRRAVVEAGWLQERGKDAALVHRLFNNVSRR